MPSIILKNGPVPILRISINKLCLPSVASPFSVSLFPPYLKRSVISRISLPSLRFSFLTFRFDVSALALGVLFLRLYRNGNVSSAF